MQPERFVQELLQALEPYREQHYELARAFYATPRADQQTVALLKDRAFRELDGAVKVGQQLAVFMGVDRDLFRMLAKQAYDESYSCSG